MNKWLMLLAILLLSGCSAAEEPAILPSSNGNSTVIDSSSSSVDMVSSPNVSQIEESNINYAFPLVEEKDWEQGDYKILTGGAVEKRDEYDQDIVFGTLAMPGEQYELMTTVLPQLARESAQGLCDNLSFDEGMIVAPGINASIEVEGYYRCFFLNDMYGVWQFHLDKKKQQILLMTIAIMTNTIPLRF